MDTLQAVESSILEQQASNISWITAFTTNQDVLEEDMKHINSVSMNTISCDEIALAQRDDTEISKVIKWIESKERPTSEKTSNESRYTRYLLHEWNKLELDKHGLLRRKSGLKNQIVLPKKLHWLVYEELHEKMGHLGADRVLELARARFYWPHMQRDVESYISHKCRCAKQNVPTFQTRAPLLSITTTAPFQMVSLDFVHLVKSSGGYEYMLVIMDHFTRYAQAYATRNKSAKTVAEKLYNENHLFKQLEKL